MQLHALEKIDRCDHADPLEFLAERLREENMHIKLESQEKRIASIRIQVLSTAAAPWSASRCV